MASYHKGRAFEHRCKRAFLEVGYGCERRLLSKPFDLVVLMNDRVIFVCECKKTMRKSGAIYFPKKDVKKLYREAGKREAVPLLLYGFARSPIYVALPSDLEETEKFYKLKEGRTLEEFLEGKRF
jgi:Holliday junction resolvase